MFSHDLEYIFNKEYSEWYDSLFENNSNKKKDAEELEDIE